MSSFSGDKLSKTPDLESPSIAVSSFRRAYFRTLAPHFSTTPAKSSIRHLSGVMMASRSVRMSLFFSSYTSQLRTPSHFGVPRHRQTDHEDLLRPVHLHFVKRLRLPKPITAISCFCGLLMFSILVDIKLLHLLQLELGFTGGWHVTSTARRGCGLRHCVSVKQQPSSWAMFHDFQRFLGQMSTVSHESGEDRMRRVRVSLQSGVSKRSTQTQQHPRTS